jgi:hypothetical protein
MNNEEVAATALSNISGIATASMFHSIFPASILEMSTRLLTSESNRSDEERSLIARVLLKTAVLNPGQHPEPCPHLPQETAERDSRSAATTGLSGDRADKLLLIHRVYGRKSQRRTI